MKKTVEVTLFVIAMILASWGAGQLFLDFAPLRGMKIYATSPMDSFRPVVYCFWSSVAYAVFALLLVRKEGLKKRVVFYALSCAISFAALLFASLVFLTYQPDISIGVNFHRFPVLLIPAFFIACALLALLTFSRKKRPNQTSEGK